MTKQTELYLSIGLIQPGGEPAYAGNHDEIVYAFLTRDSEHERYGYEAGCELHDQHIAATHGDDDQLFMTMITDHGRNPYTLDPDDCNRLWLKFDDCWVTKQTITEYLDKISPLVKDVYLRTPSSPADWLGIRIADFKMVTKKIKTTSKEYIYSPKVQL